MASDIVRSLLPKQMALRAVCVAALLACALSVSVSAQDWSAVDQALQSAIEDDQAFPGCVAIVADKSGILYAKPHGSFTYGLPPPYNGNTNPPMALSTLFDMASCTKVVATNTAVALLYQSGYFSLDTPIASEQLLGPDFAQNGKGPITVRHCLLHNAGFPPDPVPWYWQPEFGCPQSQFPVPDEDFSCRTRIYASLMTQTVDRPPNQQYVYSDLSFITLANVVGKVASDNRLVTADDFLPNCLVRHRTRTQPHALLLCSSACTPACVHRGRADSPPMAGCAGVVWCGMRAERRVGSGCPVSVRV
jgi:CubicO group peptidase (beta-lactamase class C family)